MMGRKKIKLDTDKAFHMRMSRETWILLKKASFISNKAMGDIVVELVEKKRSQWTKRFSEIGELGTLE